MNKQEKLSVIKAYNLFKEALIGKGLSSATILAYTTDIKQFNDFLIKKKIENLDQITEEHLKLFQNDLSKQGYLPVSFARKLNALRKYFSFLNKKGFIDKNPLSLLASPKFKKSTPRILTRMEYRALRDTCREKPRTAALTEIFLQTGLKVSEVANLNIDDVKSDRLVVKKDKKSVAREILFTPSVKQAVERYLKVRPKKSCSSLFVTKNNTPLLVRNMSTILMRCFRQAEIKNASLNALRHTWIYNQLASGVSLQLVSQLAGHKRLTTTATYLSLIDKPVTGAKTKIKEL